MHVFVVVSEFPKVTETFVVRNALHFMESGCEVSLFHLKPFRHHEVIHDEARPVIARARGAAWLGRDGLFALLRHAPRLPGMVGTLIRAFWREPNHLAASLAIIPKSLVMADVCRAEGVAHIHAEFAGYPATAAWIMSRASGIPFSFSAHAHDIFITQSLLTEKARDARFVRAISGFNKRFLEDLPGFPAGKTHVLRCGVAIDGPQAPPPAPPGQGRPLRLVFVGALLPRKGVGVLLEALARVREDVDWRLDVVGGGRLASELTEMAARLVPGRVRFHGAQPSSEVRAQMAQAHAVVVPSVQGASGRSEGIPVVLMEALSLSRPVIASDLSGIPELVSDGQTGWLVPPGNAQALAHAVERIWDDYATATRIGQAGRSRIETEFDIKRTARALLERISEASA